jgi:hypothetical protein
MFHLNRFMWTGFRGCRVRVMLRPGSLASPSPTRAFTFELSSHESPQRNVEYNYAVNSQLPRPDFHRLDTQPYGLQQSRTVSVRLDRRSRSNVPFANDVIRRSYWNLRFQRGDTPRL